MTADLDAILFDADGVVQTVDEKWWYAMTGLLGPADEDRVARFVGDVMEAEKPSLAGEVPFLEPLTEVLVRWQITTPAEDVLRMWHHIEVDLMVIAGVQQLRAGGVRCALATNQHPERAAYMRENLGYDQVFDDLFYSCALGVAKPDPVYFRTCVERLGTEAGRTLLLDDNSDNVASAREVGLCAELFTTGGGRAELDRILAAYAVGG